MVSRVHSSLSAADLEPRLAALGFSLPPAAMDGLAAYLSLLMQWNKVMNLVGAATWEQALENLIADSFLLADFLRGLGLPDSPVCWDLGAGAGLPGIPLRLVWQDGTYTLVDSREKRVLFLRTALARSPLPRTTAARARVEDFFPRAGKADLIVSRAFMPWRDLLPLVRPWLAENGAVVFLTLTPAPDADLPPEWRVAAQREYSAAGQRRWFWAIREARPLREAKP